MKIKKADFLVSNNDIEKCPAGDRHEFAFIGRSNVGKSSLINMLCDRKNLAKTSSVPGKTQLINHFNINDHFYFVDLPGYGYAKTSKKLRKTWETFSGQYILKRENLDCLFVLVDSRHEPQKIDIEFMQFLGQNEVPFIIVFTKTDKMKKNQLIKNLELYKRVLLEYWDELPEMVVTSSEKKLGKEHILEIVGDVVNG
jgi:GTP-binding protein